MSRPNLYAIKIRGGKRKIFTVSQVVKEADITKRAARRLIKSAIKAKEIERLPRRNGRGGTMIPDELKNS